jgi:hypothetical protein
MKLIALIPASLLAVALGGCVVAPLGAPAYDGYGPPAGVAYVGPTYAVPGPGWVWAYHPHYGWGYHNPRYGWHRGWR